MNTCCNLHFVVVVILCSVLCMVCVWCVAFFYYVLAAINTQTNICPPSVYDIIDVYCMHYTNIIIHI